MKRILPLIIALAFLPAASDAQLGGLINKVKSKVKNRADQKVDAQVDKTLDAMEGKASTPGEGNGGESAPAEEEKVEKGARKEASTLKSFSRFDFIPGDLILYYDNFEGEAIGELPTGWNTSGSGEVTTLDKFPGNWLRLHKNFIYLSSNTKEFGENYTAEFDVIFRLKNNGWGFPELRFGFFASKDEPNGSNIFLHDHDKFGAVEATVYPGQSSSSRAGLVSNSESKEHFVGTPRGFSTPEGYYEAPLHISIQVQKERCRIWINEEKLFDVPKGVPVGPVMNQVFFELSHTNYPEEQYGVYISNIKVATGKPDTRHKLVEEGKFSTTGILFDFQSAVIRPESYAVVKEIAGVLKENPAIRIKVRGHTSSDGDDQANMELSKKRAASVKDLLTSEFGIEAGRLETEGMGETQPVADNKTKEGKLLNRRVEFIKL